MANRTFAFFAILSMVHCLVLTTEIALANTIHYSWSGRMVLSDDLSPDPWLIGESGADFLLLTTVSSTAIDDNDSQIPFAVFAAIAGRLWIDGEEVTYVDGAYIDFADTNYSLDLVTAGGMFNRFGQALEISSVIGLDASTFSLNFASEAPPHFSSTVTATIGSLITQPYVTTVDVGTLVVVAPEPSVLCLVNLSLMLLALSRARSGRSNGNLSHIFNKLALSSIESSRCRILHSCCPLPAVFRFNNH